MEIAYNPIMQMLVVHKADGDEKSTLRWVAENKKKQLFMRKCGCKGFANALFDNMGWNLDYKYKVVGVPMEIDGQIVLVFTLEEPIRIVPIKMEEKGKQAERASKNRQTKELLEAGFAPEDFQLPSSMSDIDLGSDTLNEKARNAAKSRAIYYDNYTSASGEIHVADLGEKKFDPECIRQIIQKNREPVEGWSYLRGVAVIRKNSFTIMPETVIGSFGAEVYEGKSVQEFVDDFHKAVDDYLALCEAEGSEPEVTGSLLLQEVLALEQTVRDFDHQSVDLSALTDAELYGIETSKLPLYALHDKAYKERLRRCDVRAEEQRKEQGRLKARYGYRYPDLNEFNAMDVMRAEAYEKGVVKGALGCCDEAAARAKIHEVIPTITDAEIDEYAITISGDHAAGVL